RTSPASHNTGRGVFFADDERSLTRPAGQNPDIGAFQSQGFTVTAVDCTTPQSTLINTCFEDLAVIVTANNECEPVQGGVIHFTVNSGGSQGVCLEDRYAEINCEGEASTGARANSHGGSYEVDASAGGVNTPATFELTNTTGLDLGVTVSDN